ncbi:hypothetical protein SCARR_03302 [Pontiella sulfatireligans]|uniref:Uncharacterized protein n=1 Tax=Pontiella sulfatireligans TaxID=2750658 RepID=A0A6C2ULU1_9BACT|nr:hypothetical protein SCARR_03302 [Pontiella sulfatireligans]
MLNCGSNGASPSSPFSLWRAKNGELLHNSLEQELTMENQMTLGLFGIYIIES